MAEGDRWANATQTTVHTERPDGKYWCGFSPQPNHRRTDAENTCDRCERNRAKAKNPTLSAIQGRPPKDPTERLTA
jgi:hypothetical protein